MFRYVRALALQFSVMTHRDYVNLKRMRNALYINDEEEYMYVMQCSIYYIHDMCMYKKRDI